MSRQPAPATPPSTEPSWRRYRQEIVFLTLFLALLGGSFTLISVSWVNDHLVEPYTAGIARVSGAVLDLIGQDVTMQGTVIRNARFAVNMVALFLTGIYFPKLFDASHTVVWQTLVILSGVLLWIFWANRVAAPAPARVLKMDR